VHFVDSKLDTGDIVETAEVDILSRILLTHCSKSCITLGPVRWRVPSQLSERDSAAVAAIFNCAKSNSRPTLEQIAELRRRLRHWQHDRPLAGIVKNLFCLGVYYSGLYTCSAGCARGRAPQYCCITVWRFL